MLATTPRAQPAVAAILGGGEGPTLLRSLGVSLDGLVGAAIYPLIHISILFAGSVYMKFTEYKGSAPVAPAQWPSLLGGFFVHLVTDDHFCHDRSWGLLLATRSYIIAPMTEEWIFRSCMCPVFIGAGFSTTTTIVVAPLFFSLAHLHHMFRGDGDPKAKRREVAFQMVYTAVFGWYAAFLFLRTGNVIAPILAHSFCNIMQVPPFHLIKQRDDKIVCWSLYALGVLSFLLLAPYLIDPTTYNSIWYPI